MPLVQGDHVRRRHDPRRNFALEDDMPLSIKADAVLAAHTAIELGEKHLVAVPLRRALLVARRFDWVAVRLTVEVDLSSKRGTLTKRQRPLAALQDDMLGDVEVAELEGTLVGRMDHAASLLA